ncbi:hypothetical protein NZK35_34230 [Stieleria sp. ICT_E10.1]|uniref:hypothetical protein n=1 Tax=Stieleria sedimenti TaxID=2976331 RepID=UPI0021807230|nr:hypothetical protein [Stieleria sedimenti]MCS7471732.1 hypothetical protein [Stieleria sedimenti]
MRRFAFFVALFSASLVGCSDPARPHLELLLVEYGRVVGKPFPDLDLYDGDERRIRYLHANSVATHEMLKDYLSIERPITAELKQFLIDWQKVSKRSMDLHAKMIEAERYTYNADEQELAERLVKGEALAGFELMDHFEGY